MKPKANWSLLVAVVVLFCLGGWASSAQSENAPSNSSSRVVWEYKTIIGNRALREDQLNELGAQGWELVMFDDGERGNGSFKGTYYFKRAK